VATLPLSWRRVGAKHGCPQGKALMVFHHGGKVCVGMGRARFLGKWGGERGSSVAEEQNSSSPASACAGEEEAQCRSKRHCFVLFPFFFEGNAGVLTKTRRFI